MGSYRAANEAWTQDPGADAACRQALGRTTGPVIECHRQQGRLKGGAGLNFEQQLAGPLRLFGRLGWNDGHNESFAYTEVDSTVLLGVDVTGGWWRRDRDRTGLAAVSNGLSEGHRRYLALGGQGFLLGDGMLEYGRESIVEGYYTAFAGRGLSVAADLQFIDNPGYNRARGPVAVGAVRLHLEL
jgi:high affinity Mn2+ porin